MLLERVGRRARSLATTPAVAARSGCEQLGAEEPRLRVDGRGKQADLFRMTKLEKVAEVALVRQHAQLSPEGHPREHHIHSLQAVRWSEISSAQADDELGQSGRLRR